MSEVPQATGFGETESEQYVEVIGYIGGELGYCEAVVVEDSSSRHFLLYDAQMRYDTRAGADVACYWVVRFPTRETLEDAFDTTVRNLRTDENLPWEQTDETLGVGVTKEALGAARSQYSSRRR